MIEQRKKEYISALVNARELSEAATEAHVVAGIAKTTGETAVETAKEAKKVGETAVETAKEAVVVDETATAKSEQANIKRDAARDAFDRLV